MYHILLTLSDDVTRDVIILEPGAVDLSDTVTRCWTNGWGTRTTINYSLITRHSDIYSINISINNE